MSAKEPSAGDAAKGVGLSESLAEDHLIIARSPEIADTRFFLVAVLGRHPKPNDR
ncbi:hypothetical protein [Nereida sp.]|uniref:hypothetical protein n=1 Tax=Nereida sp. TaxID=2736090 RepID=UPI003F6A46D7